MTFKTISVCLHFSWKPLPKKIYKNLFLFNKTSSKKYKIFVA